jgi:hypothetical protein
MNEDELVVDKQRAANHLGSEVARHQPVRGIESLGFDSRRLHHFLTLLPHVPHTTVTSGGSGGNCGTKHPIPGADVSSIPAASRSGSAVLTRIRVRSIGMRARG